MRSSTGHGVRNRAPGAALLTHARSGSLSEVRPVRADGGKTSAVLRCQRWLKRGLDLAVALAGLVILAPALALIGMAIRLDSAGPALFRQRRIGKGGRSFTFYKFRTMYVDNDSEIHKKFVSRLISGGSDDELRGDSGALKIERDPRVTHIGRILRRTSIDELPQLFNVLKGEMSLVGPRPPVTYEAELYESRHLRRLEVLPGMTGLWQVSGRTRTSFEEMIDLDIAYVESWSIRLDIRILLRTIGVVLSREGAW